MLSGITHQDFSAQYDAEEVKQTHSPKTSVVGEEKVTKEDLICPITQSIMVFPVKTKCGHTFEEEAIRSWKKNNCPCCRADIEELTENVDKKNLINRFIAMHPELASDLYFSDTLLDRILDENLPEKIALLNQIFIANEETLNKTSKNDKDPLACGNYTTLYMLTCFKNYSFESISSNPKVIANISAIGLNHILQKGKHAGYSPLYWLCSTEKGQELLLKYPKLRAKIDAKAFNHIPAGQSEDIPPVFRLALTPKGRQMIFSDKVLRSKIAPETLDRVIASGNFSGQSLSTVLAKQILGPQIILQLRKKTSPAKAVMFSHTKHLSSKKNHVDLHSSKTSRPQNQEEGKRAKLTLGGL